MYKEIFPTKIKKAREEAGYTQKQIEEITGIKQATLSHIENGTREPNIETLGKLIDFYEVSADWILGTGKKKKE